MVAVIENYKNNYTIQKSGCWIFQILMILNAWNGAWPDTYFLQIIIPEELEKLQRFCRKLDFKDIKFIVKVRDIHKTEKNNSIGISVFGYENKKNIQSVCQIILSRDILIYYW